MRYLKHLLDAFDGDERLALAGWYQGERAVRAHGLYNITKPFVATCWRSSPACRDLA